MDLVWWAHTDWRTHGRRRIRRDAGAALERMDKVFFRDTGEWLVVNHAHRSWMRQLGVKILHPKLAAWPWESAHVKGLAIDLRVGGSFGSPIHLWLQDNAHRYGWYQPHWATERGSRPEPWHWEFLREEAD